MRILITGGCGFLGSHLVEHFLKNTDASLVVIDKLTYASNGFNRLREVRETMRDGEDVFRARVHMLGGVDLAQPLSFGVLQEIGKVEYIIHAAAESHVDHSIIDPLPFLQSNVIGTHNLLWAARTIPSLKRVFLISTDEVYGPAPFCEPVDGGPRFDSHGMDVHTGAFGEGACFRPANPYAAAKAGGECIGMAYANTYRLPITIVNTMNLIGERQHPEKFVPLVIDKVLRRETVSIHADATRTRAGTRFYLHCRTFANALEWLINLCGECRIIWTDGPAGDHGLAAVGDILTRGMPLKVHVCGEREISNLELAQMIARILSDSHAPPPGSPDMSPTYELQYELVDFHSSRPGHDLRYAMDDSTIRSMGWVRPMNLEQSLEKTVRWYLSNPHWLELKKEN